MRSGRRGARQAPFSLFAFQDIMTAVIGILLLVVLLMCLQLSTATAAADAVDANRDEVTTLRRDHDELTSRQRALDARIERLQARLAEQRNAPLPIERVATQRATLSELYREVATVEDEVHETFERLRELTTDSEIHAQLDETLTLEQQAARLKTELTAVRRHQGLTYLLNAGFAKTPLLVVVAADELRVGVVGARRGALTFAAPQPELRQRSLEQWLAQYTPTDHYVLLVVKPSGQPQVDALRRLVTTAGFAQGLDLCPEDWTVLQYSQAAGGEP